jgi:tetratricopeptide (TPR) repeat protein
VIGTRNLRCAAFDCSVCRARIAELDALRLLGGQCGLGAGLAYFMAGRFEEARAKLLSSLQEYPGWAPNYRFLAACCAQMGRMDEARELVRRLRDITPVLLPDASHWRNPEQRERYLSGLRLAMEEAT